MYGRVKSLFWLMKYFLDYHLFSDALDWKRQHGSLHPHLHPCEELLHLHALHFRSAVLALPRWSCAYRLCRQKPEWCCEGRGVWYCEGGTLAAPLKTGVHLMDRLFPPHCWVHTWGQRVRRSSGHTPRRWQGNVRPVNWLLLQRVLVFTFQSYSY